jgi:hypothetical protein
MRILTQTFRGEVAFDENDLLHFLDRP